MSTPPLHSSSNEWLDTILRDLGNTIAELHRKFRSSDKRERIDWALLNGRCQYEESQAKQAIEAHYATQLSEAYKKGYLEGATEGYDSGLKEGQE